MVNGSGQKYSEQAVQHRDADVNLYLQYCICCTKLIEPKRPDSSIHGAVSSEAVGVLDIWKYVYPVCVCVC